VSETDSCNNSWKLFAVDAHMSILCLRWRTVTHEIKTGRKQMIEHTKQHLNNSVS